MRAVTLFFLASALGAATLAWAGPAELVSRVAPDQVSDTAMGEAYPTSVSADGRYVAFLSPASNLVSGQDDRNGGLVDVFLRDRVARTTVLVSRSAASPTVAANGWVEAAVVSPDGRYVAWAGTGTNVVPGQLEGTFRQSVLFLFDRLAGTNQILVESAVFRNSEEGLGARPQVFSADGRFLLFRSEAPDVVPGQSGIRGNLFLYDLTSGAVTLVSHASGSPATGVGAGGSATLSAEGRFVAFSSSGQILVFDRLSGALEDLGRGQEPVLSRDGRFVAFLSGETNRVAGQIDTNGIHDIFLYDRVTRATVLVTRTLGSAVETGNGALLSNPVLSPDGRSVAFVSKSTNLVPGQEEFIPNLFLFDRIAGTVRFVAQASFTRNPVSHEFLDRPPVFSGDGRSLLFYSSALNVIPGQVNPEPWIGNLFLYDVASRALTLITASSSGSPTASGGIFHASQISEDGRVITFSSNAADLVAGLKDVNEAGDVFSYSVSTGETEALSLAASPSSTPAGSSSAVSISADGRWVAFESVAAHLVSGQVDLNRFRSERHDLFLYDAQTQATLLVSRASSSLNITGEWGVGGTALSADGRFVAFTSRAENLITPREILNENVFLFDRQAGTTAMISRSAVSGRAAGGGTNEWALSADGRYLVFVSGADDLVAGQIEASEGPDTSDVFLYDRVAGSITLVSHSSAGPRTAGDWHSGNTRLSANGRYVLFASQATNLVSGQTGSNTLSTDVFLYDRVTGITSLVSHTRASKTEAAGTFGTLALSADGRYAAFWSGRADLGAVDGSTESYNLYLYDRTTGTNALVSSFQSSPSFFAPEAPLLLSRDGRILAFVSTAPLVPGQSGPPDKPQVFLYDRTTRTITLASRAGSSPTAGMGKGGASSPSLSADGRYVSFVGNLRGNSNLPDTADVFLFDRITGTTVLASPARGSDVTGAGGCSTPQISANGQAVAFTSSSPNLAEPDFNRTDDAFLFRLSSVPGGPVTLPPCTLFDTRRSGDGPALRSNVRKNVAARGACGVPASAKAVRVKVTALQGTGKGNLRLFTGNAATPSGTLRFAKRKARSGLFTVPLSADGTFTLLPYVAGNGTVQVVVEVQGYNP